MYSKSYNRTRKRITTVHILYIYSPIVLVDYHSVTAEFNTCTSIIIDRANLNQRTSI